VANDESISLLVLCLSFVSHTGPEVEGQASVDWRRSLRLHCASHRSQLACAWPCVHRYSGAFSSGQLISISLGAFKIDDELMTGGGGEPSQMLFVPQVDWVSGATTRGATHEFVPRGGTMVPRAEPA
jgi:hypothetical protein